MRTEATWKKLNDGSWVHVDGSQLYTQSQAKRMHELLKYIAESYRGTMAGEQADALLAELEKGE